MESVDHRDHVKQRAVRIVLQINTLRDQFLQCQNLRCQECDPYAHRDGERSAIAAAVLATKPSARVFERPTTRQDQRSAEPQHMRNSNMLPVQRGARAGEVYDADGDKQGGNRNQSESHGQQTSAGNMPAISILASPFVITASSAVTAGAIVVWPSTICAGDL